MTEGGGITSPVEIKRDGVYLDGEKFFLISGDFHYFRTHPDGWRRRMELMKDFGLTATTTYVAWNLHEPRQGKFCFEGIADLPRYLQTAQDVGLKVILRCSPYLCAEYEMGGLPSWLLRNRTLCVRSSDPAFMTPVREYSRVLAEKIRPYLYTSGGPIILIGLENEYGSFGNDREYLRQLSDLYRELGLNVPFISANGVDDFKYENGTLPENWNGVDAMALPSGIHDLELLREKQPDKPLMASEAWAGWIQFWGKDFGFNRNVENHAAYLRKALEMGAAVNFYMFCGGTNFAFTSGALCERDGYMPMMTSYDYDAPISEDGVPRAKYFAMRDVLDEYLGKPKRPHTAPAHPVQSVDPFYLTECAPLLGENEAIADLKVFKHRTVCMEDLGQDYGFILYKTSVEYTDSRRRHLRIDGLADRATVYLNKHYIGCYLRDAKNEDIVFTVPQGGAELSILVENMGRVNYGYGIYDRKGINGCIHVDIELPDGKYLFNYACFIGFEIEAFPMKKLSGLKFGAQLAETGSPAFYRGSFRAKAGVDTFLDMKGWEKGIAFVNGFHLGRYWSVGPQRTLYVPGEILKEENEILLFEIHSSGVPQTVSFIDRPILDEAVQSDRSMMNFELK